jgi:hypothetical protein
MSEYSFSFSLCISKSKLMGLCVFKGLCLKEKIIAICKGSLTSGELYKKCLFYTSHFMLITSCDYYLTINQHYMASKVLTAFALILFSSINSNAQNGNDAPLAAAKAWWHAVTFGDTIHIKNHSTENVIVTFNNGRSFTYKEIIAQVSKHHPSANITLEWSESSAQLAGPQTAIITNRIVEKVGAGNNIYKFITVLVKNGKKWKVAAAQSTRELGMAKRITAKEAGDLIDYAGSYRTPGGMTMQVMANDSVLLLKEPSGTETILEPIAPGLFEFQAISFAGNVRFSFHRDATGSVVSLTRIAHNIVIMPRMK